MKSGYVADVVALANLCQEAARMYCAPYPREVDGWASPPIAACIIEAKATASDFRSTFIVPGPQRNRQTPEANLHWVIAPKGIVDHELVPTFWGLIEFDGVRISEAKTPAFCELAEEKLTAHAYQLLWHPQGFEEVPERTDP